MTLEEQIKANKRLIGKAIRELDRERTQLERDQKRLELEIKKLGKCRWTRYDMFNSN